MPGALLRVGGDALSRWTKTNGQPERSRCRWCGAAFSHRPPGSQTILWQCGSWRSARLGREFQTMHCRVRQLERQNERLRGTLVACQNWAQAQLGGCGDPFGDPKDALALSIRAIVGDCLAEVV